MIKMDKKNQLNENALSKALNLLKTHRRNYKQKVHDEVRDYIANNLNVLYPNLILMHKELRVVGGYIDIVAKDNEFFYLIEIKTRKSKKQTRNPRSWTEQLLKQKDGLKYILSLFTKEDIPLKLILVESVRKDNEIIINQIDEAGNWTLIKNILLNGD